MAARKKPAKKAVVASPKLDLKGGEYVIFCIADGDGDREEYEHYNDDTDTYKRRFTHEEVVKIMNELANDNIDGEDDVKNMLVVRLVPVAVSIVSKVPAKVKVDK